MKKPRGDAKLKTLPDALQEKLFQTLRHTTAEKSAAWLLAEHGVETSTGSLSEFFAWYPRTGWLKQSASFASDLQATIKQLPKLKINAEQASAVAQVAFELQAAKNQDPELFLALQKGKLRSVETRIKEEAQALKVRQYEDKITVARASLEKAKSKGGISAETLSLIEQQLKLL